MASDRTTTARRTRSARASALSTDSIVDKALELFESSKSTDISMRRLGEEMGVDPTAFYRHFRDKDDLILAVWDRVMGEQIDLLRRQATGLSWREKLKNIAMTAWTHAQRHPVLYSQCFARVTGGRHERELVESLLATLSGAGLDEQETVLYYRVFADALLGGCASMTSVLALEPELREKDATAWSRIYAVLPQEEYPAARAHGAELASVSEDRIFETMMDAILDRIEGAIARAAAEATP
ncbi:TetR/AcrR family transcriptional regulator [Nocardioides sp. Iso805N]|uniref:TetR/AcrR family transcriptional regulator n=1 Tax=Nocardioides sp. Iso805N TaxID=1283287 RepID=UPI000380F26B|nr:TetR/AcrR family transcriptional regulator [Nocardioides sp. Iso805N]